MSYPDNDGLGLAILEALGMKTDNVTGFTLTCAVGAPSRISVDHFVMPIEGFQVPMTRTYRITPIDEEDEL